MRYILAHISDTVTELILELCLNTNYVPFIDGYTSIENICINNFHSLYFLFYTLYSENSLSLC